MNSLHLDYKNVDKYINNEILKEEVSKNKKLIENCLKSKASDSDSLGWINTYHCNDEDMLTKMESKAKEIRENADIFVLIGVGGSNQGARTVIKSMGDSKVEILYAGNNLSPAYLKNIMEKLKGKSVYVNVIAKNFATLEPGITFRVMRQYLEETYGEKEAANRIIATGSLNGSSLEKLGKMKGYTLLPFPLDVGGRFSVLTPVGLFPIAVSGVDIRKLLAGASEMEKTIHTTDIYKNDVVNYAVIRNLLLKKGYNIEILGVFEPLMEFFNKWWVQLFGESEGKDGKGIYPSSCSFSEDLHSLGQYIQDGQKILFETFINIEDMESSYPIPLEKEDIDEFNYLNGKDFSFLNRSAYEATVKAHYEGGIPVLTVNVPKLTPFYMGQLFYFFEVACYLSATILGVDPFNQPGVEAYKINMFKTLKA
ncbi:glucose-6-phosphate isomerase [Vallitalea longa]|uniref:Glucose-6-phosphate isomerase n=1 Tax=Vallitalea longa TaxID=2936439 RepID=A0A9W5YE65_9FIRM|nr:glucose-6-phosphate isomerase [Vallitalea longa]GKX31872.1 glucose-6-phosphate isomerase [Vallitalea longa]